MGQGMQVNDSAWLSNLLPGGSDHNYVPRGYCYDEGELVLLITFPQMLSKPCLSLSFAFVSKAKCLLLLLPPPCHDQDHLHIAWGWDEPPLPTPLPPPPPSFSLYLSNSPDDMSFLPLPPSPFWANPFSTLFLSIIYHAFLWFYFNLRWFALCERSVCLRILPPIECYLVTVADFYLSYYALSEYAR